MRWRQRLSWWLVSLAERVDPGPAYLRVELPDRLRTDVGPVAVDRAEQLECLEAALDHFFALRRELVIANHAETALARHHPELFEEEIHGTDSRS